VLDGPDVSAAFVHAEARRIVRDRFPAEADRLLALFPDVDDAR
jgi:hypothetical protein